MDKKNKKLSRKDKIELVIQAVIAIATLITAIKSEEIATNKGSRKGGMPLTLTEFYHI